MTCWTRPVRDWRTFVRERLPEMGLSPEREARVVRELASQLEDFYREAIARGASNEDADRYAVAQIPDWNRMATEVSRADHVHARPRVDRLVDVMEARPMARATCSQRVVWALNCFRPAGVRR